MILAGVLLLLGLYLVLYTTCESPTASCEHPYNQDGLLVAAAGGAVGALATALWLVALRRTPRPALRPSPAPAGLQITPMGSVPPLSGAYFLVKGIEDGYELTRREQEALASSGPACPRCGMRVGRDAGECPQCGSPLRNRTS